MNRMDEELCDNYCKWPDECEKEEELAERCWECPLNWIGN